MKPVVEFEGVRVFHGDCIEVLKGLPENSVDSIVTDPPYGLEFMGKDWDAPWKANGKNFAGNVEPTADSAGGVSAYASARVRYSRGPEAMVGFQLWATEWAVECLRVLKPGGHILAFGGSRTWHRLAVAVEDAGFEIRDNIAWIYGSGFPKSLDVSKAIDKRAGAEREVIGTKQCGYQVSISKARVAQGHRPNETAATSVVAVTAPATSEAKQWEGWGTALKPAHEPIVVGRKPLVGTVAENVLLWGVGGLNIDGSRIGSETRTFDSKGIPPGGDFVGQPWNPEPNPVTVQGRWPANVILDEVTAGLLDEQSGVSVSKTGGMGATTKGTVGDFNYRPFPRQGHEDAGGASRFFYVAKASKRDRNEGLDGLEAQSHSNYGSIQEFSSNPARQNFHPTVKPTQLMRYLVKLVTPPGGVVLDPFTGSGSTGKAAILEGFDFIGVELTEDYLPIIEGRLKWAVENADDGALF